MRSSLGCVRLLIWSEERQILGITSMTHDFSLLHSWVTVTFPLLTAFTSEAAISLL